MAKDPAQLNFIDVIFEKVKPVVNPKLRTMAIKSITSRIESAKSKAEKISTEISGNPTPKRQREAEHRRNTKDRLMRRIWALDQLLEMWENNTVPTVLQKVRSVNDVETIEYGAYPNEPDEDSHETFKERYVKNLASAKRLGITNKEDSDKASELIKDLMIVEYSEEEKRAQKLQKALEEIRFQKIPGFFPTPSELIDRMIDNLELVKDGLSILEPSAGIGDMLDRVRFYQGNEVEFTAIELRPSLCDIIELKGHDVICGDFLDYDFKGQLFDRIIMNPPFEKKQDVIHTTMAFDLLMPDGVLVGLVSSGAMHNTGKLYDEFRQLVEEHGYFENIPPGSFKTAFNPTGISVTMVVLKK